MPDCSRPFLAFALAAWLAGCAAANPDPAPRAASDAGGGSGGDAAAPAPQRVSAAERELRTRILRQLQPCLQEAGPDVVALQNVGTVAVFFAFDPEGTLVGARLPEEAEPRYNGEAEYREIVDTMITSVEACSPLQDMPVERHEQWGVFPLVVSPREA